MNVARLLAETGYDTPALRVLIHPVLPNRVRLHAASGSMMKLWGSGIGAMTLGRWIFVDPAILDGDREQLARLVIHELVHVRQYNDFGLAGFMIRYFRDYLSGRRRGLSHRDAYLSISFEEEARQIQSQLLT